MITIDQLLESIDLDFEPRWVTKDEDGDVCLYSEKPRLFITGTIWQAVNDSCRYYRIGCFKISEFEGKNTEDCIYEVPRKTTGKIEKLPEFDRTEASIFHTERLYSVVNEIIDWINDNYKDSK